MFNTRVAVTNLDPSAWHWINSTTMLFSTMSFPGNICKYFVTNTISNMQNPLPSVQTNGSDSPTLLDDYDILLFPCQGGEYNQTAARRNNMLNYLETRDLNGARIEARRLSVTACYLRDRKDGEREGGGKSASLGFGSLLAGFTYEKSGNAEEAARYYEDARARGEGAIRDPSEGAVPGEGEELLVVIGWGRVPHRVAKRVPVTQYAGQGIITSVNFPTLAADKAIEPAPRITVDGRAVTLDATLDVSAEVRAEWRRIEGQVMAAAISRAIARALTGKAIEGAASLSKDKDVRAVGFLVSLFAQIAMSAADTPDTRSWETLPARVGLARVRVPPGDHRVVMEAQGYRREGNVRVVPGGWGAVSLFALR